VEGIEIVSDFISQDFVNKPPVCVALCCDKVFPRCYFTMSGFSDVLRSVSFVLVERLDQFFSIFILLILPKRFRAICTFFEARADNPSLHQGTVLLCLFFIPRVFLHNVLKLFSQKYGCLLWRQECQSFFKRRVSDSLYRFVKLLPISISYSKAQTV